MSDELMKALGFLFTFAGVIGAVYWRFSSSITSVRDELAAHKLHVAESYVTKSGLKEIKEEILGAVSGIRDDVRHLATRIDTMHEAASKPRPTRRTAE